MRPLALLAVLALAGCATVGPPLTPAQRVLIRSLDAPALATSLAKRTGRGLGAIAAGAPVAGRAPGLALLATQPARVDLRPGCSPVAHQGPFRSCTGVAVAKGLGEFLLRRKGDRTPLSAMHLYAQAREAAYDAKNAAVSGGRAEGWADGGARIRDNGAAIAAAIAVLEMGGAVAERHRPYPPEATWPGYWATSFAPGSATAPGTEPDEALRPYLEGVSKGASQGRITYLEEPAKLRIQEAKAVPSLDAIRASLAGGMPVVVGMTIHESFYAEHTARTGRVPLPGPQEPKVDAHAMLVVGYDDATATLTLRNSWGAGWGDAGYCHVPYAAVGQGLVQDAWTVGAE